MYSYPAPRPVTAGNLIPYIKKEFPMIAKKKKLPLLLFGVLFTGSLLFGIEIPPDLNDGLKTCAPEQVGIPSKAIHAFERELASGSLNKPGALLLLKDDYLIYERHARGYDRDHRHTIYSVSKAFTSALVGIALYRGHIKSVDQRVVSFFPEYRPLFEDRGKDSIKIKHLLSLSSGLDWDESTYSYEDSRNVHVQMERMDDWIGFILARPLKDKPGTRWLYNTGNVQLLSAIIKKTSGLYLHEFAEKYLFQPLKIKEYYWNTDPSGYTCAGGSDGGLRLKSRDLAKLGCLYANQGDWEGDQLLPEGWIKESTTEYINIREGHGYGYLWHILKVQHNDKIYSTFSHGGSGGHLLMIFPQQNFVIVINSSGSNNQMPLIHAIITHFLERTDD
jgi:CubicO group peptidase (beta-lactamase class C family)